MSEYMISISWSDDTVCIDEVRRDEAGELRHYMPRFSDPWGDKIPDHRKPRLYQTKEAAAVAIQKRIDDKVNRLKQKLAALLQ